MATRRVDIEIRGHDRLTSAINSAKASLGGFANSLKGLAVGAVGGFAGGAFLKSSIDAFFEAEEAAAKLGGVLKATGGAAGISASDLKEFASQLQEVTTFEDDATTSAMAVLATFTKISGQTFKDATRAAMDLSATMGQDLQSSVVQVGKALNDPIKGITALQRVGVSFSEAQKAQIKSLVESNNLFGAQQIILQELRAEFGGVAEAMAQTSAGQVKQAANAWGDFKEQIGEVAVAIGSTLIPALKELASKIPTPGGKGLGGMFENNGLKVLSDRYNQPGSSMPQFTPGGMNDPAILAKALTMIPGMQAAKPGGQAAGSLLRGMTSFLGLDLLGGGAGLKGDAKKAFEARRSAWLGGKLGALGIDGGVGSGLKGFGESILAGGASFRRQQLGIGAAGALGLMPQLAFGQLLGGNLGGWFGGAARGGKALEKGGPNSGAFSGDRNVDAMTSSFVTRGFASTGQNPVTRELIQQRHEAKMRDQERDRILREIRDNTKGGTSVKEAKV